MLSIKSIEDATQRDISLELKDSASALSVAQENVRAAQATYELALRRFEAAHAFLDELVHQYDADGNERTITDWMLSFDELWPYAFTALTLGEAIGAALKRATGDGRLTLGGIYARLIAGGFKFNTKAPRREVNAALLKLKGIVTDKAGKYWIDRAEEGEGGNE